MQPTFRQRIINYENWISSGCNGELPDVIQKELLKLFSESTAGYTFYRNELFKKSIELENEAEDLKEFVAFFTKASTSSNYQSILEHYSKNEILEIFDKKRLNAVEIATEISSKGITHHMCFLYQSYYEIETVLLAMASIAVLNTENKFEVNHIDLKDKSGRLRKGVCIDFIKARLKEYPTLLRTFALAYNSKLRHTIGHNDYRICKNSLESIDGKIKVKQDEFYESLYNLQKLNNFLIYFFSSTTIDLNQIKDCGILSIAFGFEGKIPVLAIHQLDCFFYIDVVKDWLVSVKFDVCGNELKTKLSSRTPMRGLYTDELDMWFNALKKEEYLKVILQPIDPHTNGYDDNIQIDCGIFKVCDNTFEKKIKYEINTCQ